VTCDFKKIDKVNFVNLTYYLKKMKATILNHAHPSIMEARYIEEIKKMTPQQRFEKLMAIIEISYLLKTVKKIN
jgi:hypothetical protein